MSEITEIGKPDQLLTKRYQVQFRFREGTSSTVAFVKAVRQHRDESAETETETETDRDRSSETTREMATKCVFHFLVSC